MLSGTSMHSSLQAQCFPLGVMRPLLSRRLVFPCSSSYLFPPGGLSNITRIIQLPISISRCVQYDIHMDIHRYDTLQHFGSADILVIVCRNTKYYYNGRRCLGRTTHTIAEMRIELGSEERCYYGERKPRSPGRRCVHFFTGGATAGCFS